MDLCYSDLRYFDTKLDLILAGQARIEAAIARVESDTVTVFTKMELLMATIQDLQQNMQDLRDLSQLYLDLIIAKDATAAALNAQIADLIAAANISATEKAALQAGIDAAVADSQATEDALRAGLPGVPPVGGSPLATEYADLASFNTATSSYGGPEGVTLDGVVVKAGTTPELNYFTHADLGGVINTSGPTS